MEVSAETTAARVRSRTGDVERAYRFADLSEYPWKKRLTIKLAKCGGLREALRMIATARAHGMMVMAGCMIESSLGITAAAQFAPLLDCADYDGAALVANDPYHGATIEGGAIRLPDRPGLGVTLR